ncbi:MAG: DUF2062 domain-containing protein [Pseudomonadota bacterium]
MREFIAPRKGFTRGMEYIGKRMKRLPDSPHRIALGFACGAFASFSPFFGFHFFVAAGCAWLVRGNILASLFGTIIGNPISFPLISTASLSTGRWIFGSTSEESGFDAVMDAFSEALKSIWATMRSWFGYEQSMVDGLVSFFYEVFLPYLVGGIPCGILAAVISYWLLGPIVAAYQKRRRRKLEEIQKARREAQDREFADYIMRDGREGDNA